MPFTIFGVIASLFSVFISIRALSPLSRLFSRYIFLNFNMTHVHMLVSDDKLAILDVLKRMFIAVNTFLLVCLNLLQFLWVVGVGSMMFLIATKKSDENPHSRKSLSFRNDSIIPTAPILVKPSENFI